MSYRLYNNSVIVQELSQTVWQSNDNLEFDMMSAY